jgi:Domain of unknown function (DUF4157)
VGARAQEPLHVVLQLQQMVGNQAVARAMSSPSDAFRRAVSGPTVPLPHRAAMEAAFGTSFDAVRAHAGGPEARAGLTALGARAATRGPVVVFGEAAPAPALVAHELAHVVQQRRGVSGVACERTAPAPPGSAAERAADAAGEAVASGRRVPDVGSATAGEIQRAPITTSGGEWEATKYAAASEPGRVGADIDLKFTPKAPVLADTIGLLQSVTSLMSTVAGGAVDAPGYPAGSPNKASIALGAGSADPGRAIDQGDSGDADTLPNTNPLYAVENTPGNVSATLTDVGAKRGFGSHASRKQDAAGHVTETAGRLKDTPRRRLRFAKQEWRQRFEATALVLDGPLANMYLGSVEWGWRSDDAGKATLDPDTLRVVREGPPTAAFMEAAKQWNAASFTDPSTGTGYNTVDLPLEAVDPGALSTSDLAKRLADSRREAGVLAGDAKSRKELEVVALERELGKRNVKISVKVISTEDWLGADHVYVKLKGASTYTTPVKKLNDGDSFDFLVPLAALAPSLPLTGPIEVEVYDQDWPDADDLIVKMAWAAPYTTLLNSGSMDDADYRVTVSYER